MLKAVDVDSEAEIHKVTHVDKRVGDKVMAGGLSNHKAAPRPRKSIIKPNLILKPAVSVSTRPGAAAAAAKVASKKEAIAQATASKKVIPVR